MQYLKTTFPEQTAEMDDEVLKNKLIDGCQLALSHGFETEADVMLLVDFLWRLPDGAAESSDYEWMDEILSSDDKGITLNMVRNSIRRELGKYIELRGSRKTGGYYLKEVPHKPGE